jgi:hypothetical protein
MRETREFVAFYRFFLKKVIKFLKKHWSGLVEIRTQDLLRVRETS